MVATKFRICLTKEKKDTTSGKMVWYGVQVSSQINFLKVRFLDLKKSESTFLDILYVSGKRYETLGCRMSQLEGGTSSQSMTVACRDPESTHLGKVATVKSVFQFGQLP